MTAILARHPRKSTRADWRRLAVALVLLVAASVAWRALRPAAIQVLVCSSVGSSRGELLCTALQRRFPALFIGQYAHRVLCTCGPGSAFVAWEHEGWQQDPGSVWFFADGWLRESGILRVSENRSAWLGDWDRDNHPELLSRLFIDGNFQVVLARVRPGANEIVAALRDEAAARRPRLRSYAIPACVDEDGDGLSELVLRAWSTGSGRSGSLPDWPDELVAVFDWTAPGGILTPRMLPDDGTVQFWPLPDNRPVVFDPNEPLESVVARLRPPDTQPASLPATPSGPDATP